MKHYDYLIVGAGLFGATVADRLTNAGKSCLVVDKRNHVGGNVYTEQINCITVHKYGAHIFHTNNKKVWEYMNSFAEFNRYTNAPVANYKGELYNLPFNMNTFYRMWGTRTPEEAQREIERQRKECDISEPGNKHPRKNEVNLDSNYVSGTPLNELWKQFDSFCTEIVSKCRNIETVAH